MSCTLVPIDLLGAIQSEELRQQRDLCGWDNTPRTGLKSFFWITTSGPSQQPVRAGHISLDAYAEPSDNGPGKSREDNLTIQTFFIVPKHRSAALGRSAMKQIEALATKEPYGSPNRQYITLNCMSKKHYYEEYLGPIPRANMPICNQEWYERQGYVSQKQEPRYHDTLLDKPVSVFHTAFTRNTVT
ncbi:uncharacterized protein BDV17DRAFT_290481 [Aspergillus undulatus]|uniref:uncharacterized protein n=1 Tax=Aspergillus undulatus TaxID=1810928 RepID=UPI003CCD88E6